MTKGILCNEEKIRIFEKVKEDQLKHVEKKERAMRIRLGS